MASCGIWPRCIAFIDVTCIRIIVDSILASAKEGEKRTLFCSQRSPSCFSCGRGLSNPNFSMGYRIHPYLAHDPLFLIFKSSLHAGVLPDTWKIANVSLIFEKGNKYFRENYRLISLTSVVCRVMERMIKNAIVKLLAEHSFFRPTNSDFVAKDRACCNCSISLKK